MFMNDNDNVNDNVNIDKELTDPYIPWKYHVIGRRHYNATLSISRLKASFDQLIKNCIKEIKALNYNIDMLWILDSYGLKLSSDGIIQRYLDSLGII